MTYPGTHILLRFNGHFGGSASTIDKWSCGMRFGIPSGGTTYDAAKLQTFVNSALSAAQAFHTPVGSACGSNTYFDQVAGAQIGMIGRYNPDTQQTIFSVYTPTAGAGTGVLPWNSASVFSLKTGRPRGRASNGRVYWPCLSLAVVSGTGRVASATQQTRVGNFKTFCDALNVAANVYQAGCRLVVASAVGAGDMAFVTSIRSDDRIDSIERRENDQPSTWSSATLA